MAVVRGSFSSAFTRRNCSHDKVFHAEYQRTNRTKENKILRCVVVDSPRCFPHCCPEHVRRSYCGSSLHLQVDFHAGDGASSAGSFRQPTRDDDLLVFGRFRPRESRGFRVGDRIAGAAILSSLQSEDNPTGEWIEAWLIASADRNAWLYEVNHSARWYYNWGSSAAKDKRLKEHVFEVYILYQSTEGDSRGSATDSFQVAAVSCSPPFKLLSFRRAPAETRRRGHADANAQAEHFVGSDEDASSGQDHATFSGGVGGTKRGREEDRLVAEVREWIPTNASRPTLDHPPLPRPPREIEPPRLHYWDGTELRSKGQHPYRSEYGSGDFDRRRGYHRESTTSWRSLPPAEATTTFPTSVVPTASIIYSSSSHSVRGSTLPSISFAGPSDVNNTRAPRTSDSLPSFVPSSSAIMAMTTKRPRYDAPRSFHTAVHDSDHVGSSFPPSTWRHGDPALARLETRSPSPSPQYTSGRDSTHSRRRQRTQLDDLTDVLVAVRALALTDAMGAVASLETTFRAYAGRLSHPSQRQDAVHRSVGPLASRHRAFDDVERLLAHLAQPPRSASQRLPHDLVQATAHLALWLQCDPDLARARASIHEQAASVLLAKPALAEAHERFVGWLHAQIHAFLRQRCGWSLDEFTAEIADARRTARRVDVDLESDFGRGVAHGTGVGFTDFVAQVREVFLAGRLRDRDRRRPYKDRIPCPSRLNGAWHSELARVRVRRVGHVDDLPLDALLWFWKQLGSVAVSVASQTGPSPARGERSTTTTRVLEVQSTFAPANSSGLQLVLDGRARWFRTFPSGESTSASRVGTQSFGDYHAVYDSACDRVECAMYSWPIATTGEGDSVDAIGMTAPAYCWRWQLTPMASRERVPALQVELVVERGSLKRPTSSQALAMEPLARKCDHVATWDRVLLAEWTMEP